MKTLNNYINMKHINTYISEKLKINKSTLNRLTLVPKSRDELIEMIKKEIRQNGNECDLNHIDVSKLTHLHNLFWYEETMEFNGDISQWDVSNVKDMTNMFRDSNFDGDISEWDVSNVEIMTCMFDGALFDGDLSGWDVSNVDDMSCMFDNSMYSGKNGSISKWDVSNVRNMNKMFRNSDFNQDISNWQIASYCSTTDMFDDCPIKNNYRPKCLQI